MPIRRSAFLVALGLCCAAADGGRPARAMATADTLCEQAAGRAAGQTGVPRDTLLAVARLESGRDRGQGLRPWPWAVNQAGESHWFATSAEAVAFVETALARGVTNIDIGCFQLNHRWHADAFVSVEEMFDPAKNAIYAAGFLSDLARETGTWRDAVAAYHSRTPEHAAAYLARFDALPQAGIAAAGQDAAAPEQRINRFPLLQAGLSGSAGSLVPRAASGLRLIGTGP
jgi:hypothetical protein